MAWNPARAVARHQHYPPVVGGTGTQDTTSETTGGTEMSILATRVQLSEDTIAEAAKERAAMVAALFTREDAAKLSYPNHAQAINRTGILLLTQRTMYVYGDLSFPGSGDGAWWELTKAPGNAGQWTVTRYVDSVDPSADDEALLDLLNDLV